jgi:NAD(P)-dependent dehydrogenase (short-subunit alcohol dehydrogenase family)
MLLKKKVAIVTGGNSGIGKAVVLELAKQGANVVVDYVSHPDATEELEKKVASLGDQAIGVDADVSKVADLERLIAATVKAFGRLDIMVNNAGVETRTFHPRHNRTAIREGASGQPEECILRNAACGQADDQAGLRWAHHQHHFSTRGLADARQYRVLPLQGRHADAHTHGWCRTSFA